jgi:anaerobic selenocysteine-containing dehydrogenase
MENLAATAGSRVVHAACPHDCPDTCAMLVTVADGRAVRVAGDPDHPVTAGVLCAKVNDYLERVYSAERLLHPLVRSGPKGSGEFRRASWDEALDIVAGRLTEVREVHGGEAILPYSYFGTMGYLQRDLMSARVMHALGATELVRGICAEAGMAGAMATNGASPEVDPERWPRSRYMLLWAWNPASTAPHLWRFVVQARRAGARLVVVDPYRSRTAGLADEHVRPLPGTDAALALGMMRAMVDAGVHDEDWCRRYSEGYEELLGRLEEWPAERAAQVTGVDAGTIRRLGEEFAISQPSLLRAGVGGQRHAGGPLAYRTLACLPALAGSWRHEGGGFSYLPLAIARAVRWMHLRRQDLRPGPVREINMSALGDALTDPQLAPPVKALVCWNSNPAGVAPDSARVLAGLDREDLFCVVLEQFMTDTARRADVVLPATSQLEHLDAVFSWGHHYLTYNEPAIAPLGEARPNTEIFRLLAARLGLSDPCFAEDDEQLLAAVLAGGEGLVDAAALRARGWAKIDLGQGPAPHAEGGFATPSGRLLFRSEALAARGLDPLPVFDPPAELVDADLAERFPFALLTPKTHFFLNTTFANQTRQRRRQGAPFVAVHRDDALRLGIADGQEVRVWNDRGAFVATARVGDDARPGVLVAPMGWWAGDLRGLGPQATTPQRVTTLGGGATFYDNRVALAPVVTDGAGG